MNSSGLKHIYGLFFTPGGSTAKIVRAIGERIAVTRQKRDCKELSYIEYDFTLPQNRVELELNNAHFGNKQFAKGDIVIFGLPVYAGRVPNLLLPYLKNIKGNGARAVAVVVYGNRNFDDALIELKDILTNNGFIVEGAAAFIGEHSFSNMLAAGRPNRGDIAIAESFADQLSVKFRTSNIGETHLDSIPGRSALERVYYKPLDSNGEPIDIRKVKPLTNSLCNNCGICAKNCPMGAINPNNTHEITGTCIKCCSCVRKCPLKAKYFADENFLYHIKDLIDKYSSCNPQPIMFL